MKPTHFAFLHFFFFNLTFPKGQKLAVLLCVSTEHSLFHGAWGQAARSRSDKNDIQGKPNHCEYIYIKINK